MLNQSIIVGRLAKEPEIKELENGSKVSNIILAVDRSYKNANGEYETDFIKCTCWNGVAEKLAEYCKKGDILGIKGRIQTKEIETSNGKHTVQELYCEKVTFLANDKNKEKTEEKDM